MASILVVITGSFYKNHLAVAADFADDCDVAFVNDDRFDAVEGKTFKAVIYVGSVSRTARKCFSSLIQE